MEHVRNINTEYNMLKIMTFFRYFGDCLFYGFLFLFLESRIVEPDKISMIAMITPFVALISNPLWSHLSKNANHNRIIMMILTVLEGISILVFTQVTLFEAIAVMTALTALVGSPFYSLHDGFIGTFAKTYNKDYTKIRFLGTLAYLAGTIFAGIILYFFPNQYNILLYVGGIIFVLIALFFIFIKPIDLTLTKGGEEVKRDYKAILKNKAFIVYMISFFLVNTISFTADNYVSLYFQSLDVEPTEWTFIFASFLLAEFITMFILSKKENKININILWLIATILYPLRSLILATDLPLVVKIIATNLRGISYGIILVVNVRCISKICGIENVTASLFLMGIFTAVIQIIAHFFYGKIITYIGYNYFFLIVGLIGLIGMSINLIYQIKHKFSYDDK